MFRLTINIIMTIVLGINILLGILSFKEKKKYGFWLGMTCFSEALVVFFYVGSISLTNKTGVSAFSSMYFIFMDFMALSLFYFVYWLVEDKRNLFFKIFTICALIYLFVDIVLLIVNIGNPFVIDYSLLTNDKDNFASYVYIEKGPYTIHLVYVYILIATSMCVLIKKVIDVPVQYKNKYMIVVIGIIISAIINILFLFSPKDAYPDILNIDYALLSYVIITFLCYYAAFLFSKHGMLNRLKNNIFENINQGLVLFDYTDEMTLYNSKARAFLTDKNTVDMPPLSEFLTNCELTISDDIKDDSYSLQCYIKGQNGKTNPLRCDYRRLTDSKGKTVGKLFVFADAALETDLLTGFHNWESFKKFAIENPTNFSYPTSVGIIDINKLALYNSINGRNEGDKLIKNLAMKMRQVFPPDSYFVKGQDVSLIVICYGKTETQITKCLTQIKEEFEISLSYSSASIKSEKDTIIATIKRAFDGLTAKKLMDKDSSKSAMISSLVKTLQEVDSDTEAHVKRTQEAGAKLGKRLGLSDVDLSNLSLLCLLHDIGKVAIPLEILNKPGKLTDEEFEIIKTHAIKGYEIAMSTPELTGIADMIKYHHERWDGRGYPDGLSLESIPLLSRIISVVDAYDAMINNRSYRKAKTVEEAKAEIIRCSGSQFDPHIAQVFIEMLNDEAIEEDKDYQAYVIPVSKLESLDNNVTTSNYVHTVDYAKYILDSNMNIVEITPKFTELTGYTEEDIKKSTINQMNMIPEKERTDYLCLVSTQLANNPMAYFEHRLLCKDGTIKYVFCFGRKYFDSIAKEERSEIIVANSLTTYSAKILSKDAENKSQERLRMWEKTYRKDSLTGLLNHSAFENDVSEKLLKQIPVTLIMIDVDRFKEYNDTKGHKAGDEFLIRIAQAMDSTISENDLSCRMGGDEFAIALFGDNKNSEAEQIFNKINIIVQSENGVSLSMGAAHTSSAIKTFNDLYLAADKALYESKDNGRGRITIKE